MREYFYAALTLASICLIASCSQDSKSTALDTSATAKVIHGEDNRRDLYEINNPSILDLASSTLGFVSTSDLQDDPNNPDLYDLQTFPSRLCRGQRFENQGSGPWCSGFLAAPDLVITAGHCIRNEAICAMTSIVFGYSITTETQDPTKIRKSNVFKCKEIVSREFTETESDWAVIRLDKPVTHLDPLNIRRNGQLNVGTPLSVIGHPSGLPLKVADGAQVVSVFSNYFKANMDTFHASSGSPVINMISGKVEGIMVRGARDYLFENGCRVVNVCRDGACLDQEETSFVDGEDVSFISKLLEHIPPREESDEDGSVSEPPECNENCDPKDPQPNDQHEFISNVKHPIPDNSFVTTESKISAVPALENPENLKVGIAINHDYIGDLKITLKGPNGKRVLIHNRSGGRQNSILGVFGENLSPFENLVHIGPQPTGTYTLEIQDQALLDSGVLNSWAIIL